MGDGKQRNMTTTPNEMTYCTIIPEAGTIDSGGAGGVGTTGGIMTGNRH